MVNKNKLKKLEIKNLKERRAYLSWSRIYDQYNYRVEKEVSSTARNILIAKLSNAPITEIRIAIEHSFYGPK